MRSNLTLDSTRERIIRYLEGNQTASVATLSQLWGLTRADIRHHLNALINDGVAEISPPDPVEPARRGRPQKRYRLSTRASPNNLASLGAALLEALVPQKDEDGRREVLEQVVDRLAVEFHDNKNLIQRMNQAVVYLSDHGYKASWEASLAGPRVFLRNCPYAAIIADHPVLCTMDKILLERIFSSSFNQAAKIDFQTGKPAACIFQAPKKPDTKWPES